MRRLLAVFVAVVAAMPAAHAATSSCSATAGQLLSLDVRPGVGPGVKLRPLPKTCSFTVSCQSPTSCPVTITVDATGTGSVGAEATISPSGAALTCPMRSGGCHAGPAAGSIPPDTSAVTCSAMGAAIDVAFSCAVTVG